MEEAHHFLETKTRYEHGRSFIACTLEQELVRLRTILHMSSLVVDVSILEFQGSALVSNTLRGGRADIAAADLFNLVSVSDQTKVLSAIYPSGTKLEANGENAFRQRRGSTQKSLRFRREKIGVDSACLKMGKRFEILGQY